jgi:hypothetical protein
MGGNNYASKCLISMELKPFAENNVYSANTLFPLFAFLKLDPNPLISLTTLRKIQTNENHPIRT